MKIKFVLFALTFFLIFPFVNASLFSSEDIKFSINQSEYYFKTGENAFIILEVDNSYKKQINGMITSEISKQVSQESAQYSNINTNSQPFSLEDGKKEMPLNFGSSDSPMTLKINLKFSYTEKNEREVTLEEIKIHFVEEESQKNNEKDKMKSSSKKSKENEQKPSAPDEPSQQQKLQNNQIPQDSSALKEQMQKQIGEQKEIEEAFQQQLSQNPEFQKMHQELSDKGYGVEDASIEAKSNDTGSFELDYKKEDGEQASLKGNMENGDMQSIDKTTTEEQKELLNQLAQNKNFQKFQKQLEKDNFKQQDIKFSKENNQTIAELNYMDDMNKTASIKAEFVNDTVKKVKLERYEENKFNLWHWFFILFAVLFGYFVYNRRMKKSIIIEEEVIPEKPFDYTSISKKMLRLAKKLFTEKRFKDAYGKAGQSLRLFLSHKYGLKKELTNDNMIDYLRENNHHHKEIKECFDLCSLVEFAKYKANKKDFDKITNIVEGVLGR